MLADQGVVHHIAPATVTAVNQSWNDFGRSWTVEHHSAIACRRYEWQKKNRAERHGRGVRVGRGRLRLGLKELECDHRSGNNHCRRVDGSARRDDGNNAGYRADCGYHGCDGARHNGTTNDNCRPPADQCR